MTEKLERILPTVQKPARYVGGEYGQTMKDKRSVELRVAFCFPDTYEIGMSNLGMRILYAVMNRMEGVWCERVFAPWGDMEDAMRANGLPLYALESGDPVSEFDLIAFTIGYEMSYTNVLNMLRLSGVPLHAADRTGLEHMVFAGGACVYNPEPLADFIDFFSVGEGEESTPEILELYRRAKREGWSRPEFLRAVAQIEGVYVPSLYRHEWNADGTLASVTPLDGAPAENVVLAVDEYETIRLIDLLGLTQEECAGQMGVARTTVQALYEAARAKLADMLVNGRLLHVEGGPYELCPRAGGCRGKRCAQSAGGSAFCARYQTISEDANMKIAVTYENGLVFQHFGHTQQFKLYTVENGKITSSEVVDTNGSGHGALAVFLKTHGVDTLICGGIGGGARTALAEAGIALYPGARGAADAQAEALLAGTLAYDPDTTCAHHEHHGEGHEGCHGHHGEGHTCGGHCGH